MPDTKSSRWTQTSGSIAETSGGPPRLSVLKSAKITFMFLPGILPPITTPFYPDGNVYPKKLEANVERYSRTPVAGIVVLGSTGEAIMLSDQERRDVLKCAREAT